MSTATVVEVTDFDVSETPPARVPMVAQQRTAIATTTPGDLLRYALDKGADLAQLEKLMELQQRYEANEARKAFVAAMAAFKTEPVEIFKRKQVGYKTKEGDFVGYKHAELSDVTDAIAPAMARHGLSFDWDIHQGSGTITVDCVVTHVLGHSKKVTMSGAPDSSGKKNQIQQTASTITYLQRYTLLSATGMSTKDEDDDGAGGSDDDGAATPAGKATETQERPAYSQEAFDKNKESWREIVKAGRKTPAAMIAFIETKGSLLTAAQKNTINAWGKEND
jgi:hypothetical protein